MAKAHWEKPDSSKGAAARNEGDLKPGKSGLKAPQDQDWIKAGKAQGVGFVGNAAAVLHRGSGSAPAQEYRRPPEHSYAKFSAGQGSGVSRIREQHSYDGKGKK